MTARILAMRGSPEKAELIYKHWIQHWEAWGEKARNDPKEQEWDRILMEPLRAYRRFLKLQKRDSEAAVVQSRLARIEEKYATQSFQ